MVNRIFKTDEYRSYINHLNIASGNKNKNVTTGYKFPAHVKYYYYYYYEIREHKMHNRNTLVCVHSDSEVQTFEQFSN
jgi:hypothetical protein